MPGIGSLFGALTGSSIGSTWPVNTAQPVAAAASSGPSAPPFRILSQPDTKPPTSLPRGSLLDLTA